MPTAREIRQQFIDFFVAKHEHTFVPSSPVVPLNDPTLLFANAGMNQFKPYFLGTEQAPYPKPRAVNTQKCIRAGGKHNDLDDVGKDTYHHTFFEMLGNWSFGDYFKAEAIDWAWELLVDVWGLDPKRLHATYFEGDASEGLEPDEEAKKLWEKYLPAERIHPGNKKDNFWEMGDTGPCGPCSEIHYDRSDDFSGGPLVNADAQDTVVEIWNLVFIQFNRDSEGKLTSLPAKHVDTGMGFERIVRVLQGKVSNYETDVFTPLFDAIQQATGAGAYTGEMEKPEDVAYRVIADHIRTLTFALTDGAHCGNEGRDYVLRRILRRAVRYGRQTLGVREPFFYKLVPAVVELMGDAFGELKKNPEAVANELRDEEESFSRTLDRGIELFEEAARELSAGAAIKAEDAFKLHDTYGFPLDLTQLMAEERGMSVDVAGFDALMAAAKAKSRGGTGDANGVGSAGENGGGGGGGLIDVVQQHQDLPATEFFGYDETECMPRPNGIRIFAIKGGKYEAVEQASRGKKVALVLDRTPFYAESGGQVGDQGVIQVVGGARVNVLDTVKVGEVFFHLGEVVTGVLLASPKVGSAKTALAVDADRRAKIMANHTTTHVMNRALRKHVNPMADQKGSLVDDEKLRFDFSNNGAVTAEQIEQVEKMVNADIAADLPVYAEVAPQAEALAIHGLRAVFGEKYPAQVRVVSIGVPVEDLLSEPNREDWANYSIEFCGGTHVAKTGDAEGFVIVSEEGVAKGVRRITAMTGAAAHQASAKGDMLVHRLEGLAEIDDEFLPGAIAELTEAISEATLPLLSTNTLRSGLAELQKKAKALAKEKEKASAGDAVEIARQVADDAGDAGNQLIVSEIAGADPKSLLTAIDVIRKKKPDAAIMVAAAGEDKVSFAASVPEGAIGKGLKAGDWVREVAKVTGGGGGGRPDRAQAGGKDPSKLGEALDAARAFAGKFL